MLGRFRAAVRPRCTSPASRAGTGRLVTVALSVVLSGELSAQSPPFAVSSVLSRFRTEPEMTCLKVDSAPGPVLSTLAQRGQVPARIRKAGTSRCGDGRGGGLRIPSRIPDAAQSVPPGGFDTQATSDPVSPAWVLLYSGVVPGWGQRRLQQSRWWVFSAVELIGWGILWERRRTGHDYRIRYRDLAWFVARRGTPGQRMDGDFEYYEALRKYRASGAFDADPFRGGVQPETDTTTFNGDLWSLANEIYLASDEYGLPGPGSPEYQQAMDYYVSRSIRPDFYWDWNGDRVNQAEYDRLIEKSDAALRQVTTVVGVILANHLASAFDAFITARLRASVPTAELHLVAVAEPGGRWWLGGRLVP